MIIDFHAHILPRADHGSDCSATTMAQLLLIKQSGTEAVVATPHFYPNRDRVEDFLDHRDGSIDAMLRKLPMADFPPVFPAAEVLVCQNIDEMEHLEKLTIAGTNVILLEMPFGRWKESLMEAVLRVRKRGLVPVLAHIDRYHSADVRVLLEQGIAAQLNASVFRPFGGAKAYLPLIENGSVVAFGSDLHGAEKKSYQPFLRLQKKLGSTATAVFARSEALLKGAVPIYTPDSQKSKEKHPV